MVRQADQRCVPIVCTVPLVTTFYFGVINLQEIYHENKCSRQEATICSLYVCVR